MKKVGQRTPTRTKIGDVRPRRRQNDLHHRGRGPTYQSLDVIVSADKTAAVKVRA